LGETSLERKFRFLFGAGIMVLISLSFLFYAYQTEHLAYDQAVTTCRMLVAPILIEHHQRKFNKPLNDVLGQVETVKGPDRYQYHFLNDNTFEELYERDYWKEFIRTPEKPDEVKPRPNEQALLFYAPVRASKSCLTCHQKLAQDRNQPALAENGLMAMLRVRMPTKNIEEGVHLNRALLMSTAFLTALLIMLGSWIVVRYIIVKPVKHLKEVADAISMGEMKVRSEIQTGDEFEDLSHAFNRMLRNLSDIQDQSRKANADLDRKVDELAQLNLALFESNRVKSDFLATMSHELRTPLNGILGFSDVLLSSDLNEKQKRWVQNIHTSGQQLLNLINDILDLAKLEASKMIPRIKEFNLQDVCVGMINMFRPLAEKKNIDLRTHIDPDIPTLTQDDAKIQQILQNLLSNAIKFTPEGGLVHLKAEVDGRDVVLKIIDTGVGIAPEEQELVFQKFRQSGNPLTREHAGTGLGLSIVRELSKLLGGDVTLQSELGRGSTFTVRLPMEFKGENRPMDFDLHDERLAISRAASVDQRLFTLSPDASAKPATTAET
jgi:signal transduction histidine kinase